MLLQAAERHPEYIVLADQKRRISYENWARQVTKLADALVAMGIGHGDRVAISMRNSIEFATALYATQMFGAVAVPFNFRLKADTIDYIINDSGARALIVDDVVSADDLAAVVAKNPDILVVRSVPAHGANEHSLQALMESGSERLHNEIDRLDLSMIVYTSGTTGRPKGVPLTHRDNYGRLVTYIMTAGPHFDTGARTFGAAPLYHTVGIHWVFLQTIFVNGTYYPISKVDGTTPQFIKDEGITFLFGSPTLLRQVLASSAGKMKSVTHVAYGSAPSEQSFLNEMFLKFPNATISEVYGTTEVSIPFVTRDMRGNAPGTLRPTGDHRLRLVKPGSNPDDQAVAGEPGELIIHMDNAGVFSRYWGADGERKTQEKVKDGWFYTGDLLKKDAAGNYYFLGRIDDMFISGGENIQPMEVETTLGNHPGVADAAVIGTPDPQWSQLVTAFIVATDPGLTEAKLDDFCKRSSLENFKRPRKYLFVDSIPRNPSGKILRGALMDIYVESARRSA